MTTWRVCLESAARTGAFADEYANLKECRSWFSAANEILLEVAREKLGAYEGLDVVFEAIWTALNTHPEWKVLILDESDHIKQNFPNVPLSSMVFRIRATMVKAASGKGHYGNILDRRSRTPEPLSLTIWRVDIEMRVTIAVPGTWHAFHLARQLEQRDALDTIFTTYPRFKLDTSAIPNHKIKSIRHPEIVLQVGHRFNTINQLLSKFTQWSQPTARIKGHLFDRAVSKRLKNSKSDIYVGFAGVTHQSLRTANDQGMTTIVERCSTHIRTQAELLRTEYKRHGYDQLPISDAHIRHEEEEYEIADRIIVPSEFVYNSFLDQGLPEKKLIMEPFAVDVESYRPNYNPDGKTRFIFAGGVGVRKGIPDLLKAWEKLDLDNAELLIAGSIEPKIEELISQYRSDNSIQFLGWCNNLDELYRESDVFVFPSIEEGSAYVTYEAMASGLPLITTPNSGWVGEDGEHGIEIPIRDQSALISAINQLHENPDQRNQLGENARELIETDYTWDRYGERIYRRYQSL